jgi:protease-4
MKIRKIVIGVFIVFFLLFIFSVVSFYYAVTRPPTVKPHSYLVLDVFGEVAEVNPPDFPIELFFGKRLSFRDWTENLRKAGIDDRIDGVILRIGPTAIGIAKIQELREAIVEFRDKGKKVIAFIEACGDIEYYLATAADRVYIEPVSRLFVDGVVARTTFLRGTLDKLGLEPDFIQIGAYKNAPDNLTRKEMSDEHREATVSLLENVFEQYIGDLALARGRPPEEIRDVIDRGYFTSREALEEGLVDSLKYWDEVREITKTGDEYRTISGIKYSGIEPSSLGLDEGPVIALIYVTGDIVMGVGSDGEEAFTTSGSILDAFEKVREDAGISAVVLRVNSPGGVSVAAEVIWREAMLTREKKPVVASMSDVAASGGYYIASACDAVVANPGSITGSIGVYTGKINMAKLYEKIGMNPEMIKIGKNAALFHELEKSHLAAAVFGQVNRLSRGVSSISWVPFQMQWSSPRKKLI